MARKKPKSGLAAAIKTFALGLPGAYEEHPWGESVAKVAKKVFVFLGREEDDASYGMSVKLPQSKSEALSLPYCEPTGYGLGKSGWVSVDLAKAKKAPELEMLTDWILESYRAVAPKKMLAELGAPAEPKKKKPSPKK